MIKNRIAWFYFAFDLPEEWEITAYSVSKHKGRFELHTRNGFKGQISWETVKGIPDEEKTMNESYIRHLRDNFPEDTLEFRKLTIVNTGKFKLGYWKKGDICQAQYALKEKRILLTWYFSEYTEKKLANEYMPLLKSFSENLDDIKEWGFHRLNVNLPKRFEIEHIEALPADIAVTFEDERHMRVSTHRWGLPGIILQEMDLTGFYRQFLTNSGCRKLTFEKADIHGWEGITGTYIQRGMAGMDKLYGVRWNGRAAAWYNRDEERLYAFEQVGPAKTEYLRIEDVFTS